MAMTRRTVVGDTLVVFGDSGETLFSMKEHFVVPKAKVYVSGKVTREAVHDFEDELMSLATVCDKMIIDLSGTEFISNDGLERLVEVQRELDSRAGTSLVVRGVSDKLKEADREKGLFNFLQVEA